MSLSIESLIEKPARLLERFSPMEWTIPSLKVYHIGRITEDLFPVEIKADSTKLGWLYDEVDALSFFAADDKFFVVKRKAFKEKIEEMLSQKIYSDSPKENRLVKSANGGIIGYVNTNEIIQFAML